MGSSTKLIYGKLTTVIKFERRRFERSPIVRDSSAIRSDEGLTVEKSASESIYDINSVDEPISVFHDFPNDAAPQFL